MSLLVVSRSVISVEAWAEIRRPHRADAVGIEEIIRQLEISRNGKRKALCQ